jgi:pyruvate/2-oxoglutarate dehydrogenase complex dihydrolipoamide dehydrogenase (E3) component
MVSSWNNAYLDNYKKSGAEFILGSGRFIGPKTVEVTLHDGTIRQLRGTNVIINTGTRPALGAIPGLVEAQPLTHIEALELDKVPEHLLVVGGGYIGLELSQAMRRFGSKVTIIDRNDRLMHREDDDVAEALQNLFEDEDIGTVLNATIKSVSGKSVCKNCYRTARSRQNVRRQSSAGGSGPLSEHRRDWIEASRRRTNRSRTHQSQ